MESLPDRKTILILLVERMNLFRGALATVLSAEDDLEVAVALGEIREMLPFALQVEPDVAIVDVDLLTSPGLAVVTDLTRALPQCSVLVLADPENPHALRAALGANVHGFVSKNVFPDRLVESVRRAARGEPVIDPILAVAALRAPRNPLTAREREILRMVSSGVPSTEIASRLCLSRGTVSNYVSTIIRKAGARNRLEAVRVAEESGWLSACDRQAPTRPR